MTVKKPNLDDAAKRYDQGLAKVNRIPTNHADPSYNLAVALENFAGMLASMDKEIATAVGDVQERLERLELMLKSPAGARRP